MAVAAVDQDRPTRFGLVTGITFVAALVVALVVRGTAVVGIAALFLLFVPLEKLLALRPQRVFRRGFLTDLTHLLVNNLFSTALGVALVVVGNYWGHRLTHTVPFLWRFHAVHHSIELMDWVAAGRLHPVDQAFTQAFTVMPLVILGFSGGTFAGVAVFVTLLAIFQHANVRLRFPGLRWVINTPEWHHWHHAVDPEARDKNFGLPVVDRVFGTAYMPKDRRPSGFGIPDPVPPVGYLRHLAFPFTAAARARRA